MADFIDDEASEVSSSDEEIDDRRGGGGKKKKPIKSRVEEDSSEEDEEDDDEAEEEMRDLINDEEEEEDDDDDEESGDEAAGAKRSHDSEDESSSLEDDDLDLIQENLGVRINKKKKFKRIRKLDDDDSEEEHDEGKKIQNELFGPEELLDSDDEEVQKQRSRPAEKDLDLDVDEEYEDDSDSEDNFIVDDNDQPVNARKPKRKGARHSDSAMQQAQEIFGVDFDFDDVADDYDEYGVDAGYEDEYEDEETGEIKTRRKKSTKKTIYDIYEPAELERSHLTDYDQQIRAKDVPERFQLRSVPVTEANDQEIIEEADWIFRNAFDQKTISLQEPANAPIAGKHFETVKEEIEYALKCIRNEKLEVPFIASYRREYVPTLAPVLDDKRDSNDSRSYKDLWTIYNYDEQWCKLQASKKTIEGLYIDMRNYLESKPDDPRIRKISDSDLERIHCARTLNDVEDCRLHFKLYYSQLITEMRLYTLEKKIQQQKEERATRQQLRKNKPTQNGRSSEGGEQNDKDGNEEDADFNRQEAEDDEEGGDNNKNDQEEEEEEPAETEEEKLYKRLAKFKISTSRDIYHSARENYIGEFVKKFGLTPEQFGENLREDYQKNSVSQHYTRPLDEAASHVQPGTRFMTKEEVLDAAKLMYSREISCDPLVRQTIRRYYFENAVINVKPTPQGLDEIDENHPCSLLKFLRNLPVSKLECDQFLHLSNAEKDKLLEIRFSIEPVIDVKGHLSPYHESLKALFYSDFSSIVTKEWNELRDEAIKSAMEKFILPSLEKQLRERLIREAQDKIIKTSREKLFDSLNIAPWSPEDDRFEMHEEFATRYGIRICGFTFDPDGESPCFAVIIDAEGELIDHIRLPYLNIRKRHDKMSAIDKENHAKDRVKFKQFIINKKPHAVALAAETIQTKYICQHLAQILDELHAHDELPLIPIQIVNNELSSIYMNLKRAKEEFSEFPPLLLQAVSLARKLNDPLSEFAKLCTPDDDILCLHFDVLQQDLPKHEFVNQLYQEFVTRTNAVGVDPNRVIAHPHTTNIVQFLAGLGPRKGAHLLRSIRKSSTGGQLVSRQQLVKELGMTSNIFINCAGFIKLDTATLADDFPDEHISQFDSTRIHPSSYGFAKKIAVDANTEGDDEGDISDESATQAIATIFEHPERLDDLDLIAFAEELEKVGSGKKSYTLQMIRAEFQNPYKDTRRPYGQGPTPEEVFHMLLKETPKTFYVGKLVTCQVVALLRKKPTPAQQDLANPVKIEGTDLWRCPFCMREDFPDLSVVWHHYDNQDCPGYAIGVRCKLDNGLFGFVPTKFISDKEVTDPAERVQVGRTIYARVLKVDSDKFSCELTCRTSDLVDENYKLKPRPGEYYDFESEARMKQERRAKANRNTRRPYCKRVIVHPAFENIDCKTCEKKLAEMEQGHAIIRPSSQGQNYLTVSWKVTDHIYQHVTIREEGKANAFSLGHQLFIENESYEDLDEIIARFIQPMASYAREILMYKYHFSLQPGVDEVDLMKETLFQAKNTSPGSLPYRFCASSKIPGKFLLGYMPKDKPKIEYLTVTPRGFRFRTYYFKNLLSLIKWFKENFKWNQNVMSIHGSVPMSQ
uniref:Transcription elongation factor SPT6 n=1 Tax=Aceria tosichella TaxID=561515 RepID=A0A6G1SDB0_9ACAR